MSDEDHSNYRQINEILITGTDIPHAIQKFEHASFDSKLLKEIYRLGFVNPTAIQSQAIPIILSGKNLIGLAKTGSGKTLAFVWPMITHILDQSKLLTNEGPIALILAPTRELVLQIHQETKKFCKLYNLTSCPIYGGAGKYEMTKSLKESPEIVIATPGRLIELVKLKATNFLRCTMVVLDE